MASRQSTTDLPRAHDLADHQHGDVVLQAADHDAFSFGGRLRARRMCDHDSEHETGSRTMGAVPGERQDGPREAIVYWLVLVVSGILEAVWATALGKSEGFTKLAPTGIFFAALAASMAGLAYAMRGLPIGTAYAVWVGIGAVLTVTYAMATGEESLTAFKVVFLVMIVGGVVGLKLAH